MNHRLFPRLRRRLKLSLAGLQTFTADVSAQGFAVESMRVCLPGTTVQGTIALAGQQFAFTGLVCWAKAGEPRLSVRGRFGVRFTGIANAFYEQFQSTCCP